MLASLLSEQMPDCLTNSYAQSGGVVMGTTLFTKGITQDVPEGSCEIFLYDRYLRLHLGGALNKKGGAHNNTPAQSELRCRLGCVPAGGAF
jgi:hypothetical protein